MPPSQVFERYGQQLNHIHLTALISGLAKMAPLPSPSSTETREFLGLIGRALDLVAGVHVSRLGRQSK